MIFVFFGVIAFIFMLVYDFNQIRENKLSVLNSFFFIGVFILTSCTAYLLINGIFKASYSVLNIIGITGGLIFFILMIFTLFFNLPIKITYVMTEKKEKNSTITTGMYALCRHPGVLTFFLSYFFFYLATEKQAMFFAWLIWTMLDIIYVYIQDRFIFPKTLFGYNEYCKTTPFLIPNLKSLHRFFGNKTR